MNFTVEPWAKKWLQEQRQKGTKCLEIKASNNKHYIYKSTTKYNPTTKKPQKTSTYQGTLDPKKGYTPKQKNNNKKTITKITSIKETGTIRLLTKCATQILTPLKENFPNNYDQLYTLAILRCINQTPLKRAATYWEKLENIQQIKPALSPKTLANMLQTIGADRDAQNKVFAKIDLDYAELAFDLTEFFSTSQTMSFAEKGYNKKHDNCPQINIVMAVTKDSGTPVMIRPLPGSIRDVKTLCTTIKEMNRKDLTLIMDRGFFSEEKLGVLHSFGLKFLLPVKRNSLLYSRVVVEEYNVFVYHGRLIRFGKQGYGNYWLYRFKDESMATVEERVVFMKYSEGVYSREQVEEKKRVMGHGLRMKL